MTKYTPSEEYMRYLYGGWAEEFDRFLARVRRDAWEEGYDAAAEFYDIDTCLAADNPYEETP